MATQINKMGLWTDKDIKQAINRIAKGDSGVEYKDGKWVKKDEQKEVNDT